MRNAKPLAATGTLAIFITGVGIAHEFARDVLGHAPPAELALQVTDYAAMPMTGSLDGIGNNAGSLARVNFLREEPAPARPFFVNDLTGQMYILDRTTKTLTTYLDLNGNGETGCRRSCSARSCQDSAVWSPVRSDSLRAPRACE